MDDDLMPNDGSYFFPREPADQAIARKKERAQVLEGKTVLMDLIKRYDDRIAFYGSVKAIPEEVKTNPEAFMHVVAGNAVVIEVLGAEREFIQQLINDYAP